MCTKFSFIWPIDRILSGATTPGQSVSGSDGNKGELRLPQSFSITGTSPSDCLVSYLGHTLEEGRCILQPQPIGQKLTFTTYFSFISKYNIKWKDCWCIHNFINTPCWTSKFHSPTFYFILIQCSICAFHLGR